jgi:hypothetical protein
MNEKRRDFSSPPHCTAAAAAAAAAAASDANMRLQGQMRDRVFSISHFESAREIFLSDQFPDCKN